MPTHLHINPFHFNVTGTLERKTVDKSTGQRVETWAATGEARYTDMRMQQINSRGSENYEADQQVAQLKGSFIMHAEDRAFVPATDRIVVNSENYYIEGVRPWKSSNKFIVVDWIYKDNG